ncbi:MAG: WYL domain-containing protein [Candidatus Dormibacteraeota bacterium]|nr:WYL domain-containing protein [Candidatus Dormibacteraeota bacterium]
MPAQYEPGEKLARVMQVYSRLSETRLGLTTKELADELEVTPRSVQRYIATLRDSAGVDIEEKDGRFSVGEGTRLPPMQLDRYQATQLLVALRLVHQLRTHQDPALVGALAQISRALRVPPVARYLERTLEHAEARPLNRDRLAVERTVVDAFVESRALEVEYVDAGGKRSKRELRPYFVEPEMEGRHVYVFAHDSLSGEVRPFRLDRLLTARLLTLTFQVPEDFDIDKVVSASWGIWQSEAPQDVCLRFQAEAAQWVRETRLPPSAQVTDAEDGGVEVRLRVSDEREMRRWVLGWGPLVEVLEPASLREYAADAHRRAARIYAEGVDGAGNGQTRKRRS